MGSQNRSLFKRRLQITLCQHLEAASKNLHGQKMQSSQIFQGTEVKTLEVVTSFNYKLTKLSHEGVKSHSTGQKYYYQHTGRTGAICTDTLPQTVIHTFSRPLPKRQNGIVGQIYSVNLTVTVKHRRCAKFKMSLTREYLTSMARPLLHCCLSNTVTHCMNYHYCIQNSMTIW